MTTNLSNPSQLVQDDLAVVERAIWNRHEVSPTVDRLRQTHLDLWLAEAEEGNPAAEFLLAKCHELGLIAEATNDSALAIYRRAAEKGLAIAQTSLGFRLTEKVEDTNLRLQGLAFLQEAVRQDYPPAKYFLARLYARGDLVEKDAVKSFELSRQSADQGYLPSLVATGKKYQAGQGTKPSIERAFYYFHRAAEAGDPEGEFRIGICLAEGIGVAKDADSAETFMRSAAKKGSNAAKCCLAELLLQGADDPAKLNEAILLLNEASKAGYTRGKSLLGKLLSDGNHCPKQGIGDVLLHAAADQGGVDNKLRYVRFLRERDGYSFQDRIESREWFKKAYEQLLPHIVGDDIAQEKAARAEELLKSVAANSVSEAKNLLEEAATAGDIRSAYLLGQLLIKGKHCEKNVYLGLAWLATAGIRGDLNSKRELSRLFRHGKSDGIVEDYQEASTWAKRTFGQLQPLAEAGDAEFQFQFGFCYQVGHGIAADRSQAISWYQKAADQGHPGAMQSLAGFLQKEGDLEGFLQWYRRAAEKGGRYYMFSFACCLKAIDNLTPSLLQEANEWIRKSAELGHPKGQRCLGELLLESWDNESRTEGLKWLAAAAEQQDHHAQLLLGKELFLGRYCEQNYGQAVHLFSQAQERLREAKLYLGLCYKNGLGVAADPQKAYELFQPPASKNYERAVYEVGLALLAGRGVAQNCEQAVERLRKAAELGWDEAIVDLAICLRDGIGTEADPKEAVKLLRKAMRKGVRRAFVELGRCYLRGNGVSQNLKTAAEWFRKGTELDPPEPGAALELGTCLESGTGCRRNVEESQRWLSFARKFGELQPGQSHA